ncbi:MAG: RNA polymerase sigma-70 factor [Nitrospira sp.]|jgi:RNA polymerase sigma-70 factor (ECF subfamily)|nr:MAG: RNA polymerase sigma-70 factor [Nitrospira sp.]
MKVSPSLDLERLFQEHQGALLSMLRRMVGCRDTAADLAQEAYIRLADVPPSQVIASPRAFLFRTATNLALDHFRKQKFRGQCQTQLDEAEQIPSDTSSIETQTYAKQQVSTLERTLAGLSVRTRSAFVLCRVYGFSYQEIAARLGMSERAVEKHLVKAMTRCQEALRSQELAYPIRSGRKNALTGR